jgi:hypothetical protein
MLLINTVIFHLTREAIKYFVVSDKVVYSSLRFLGSLSCRTADVSGILTVPGMISSKICHTGRDQSRNINNTLKLNTPYSADTHFRYGH